MPQSASNTPSHVLLAMGLMLGFCLFAPLIDVASKLAAQQTPVALVTLGRYVVQGLLMAPVVMLLGSGFNMSKAAWKLTALRGLVSVAATFSFIAAIRVMPIAEALAIAFVEPFVVLLLGHFFTGETVGPRRLGAAVVGFLGALLVIKPSFSTFGWVALFPVGTAIFFAFYIIITRRLSALVNPMTMQMQTAVTGALACLPLIALGSSLDIAGFERVMPEGMSWLWIFCVGLAATVSHTSMTWALSLAPASTLGPLHYFEMISAAFFSYLVFGDFPDALSWLGIAIITASGLYILHRERKAAQEPA